MKWYRCITDEPFLKSNTQYYSHHTESFEAQNRNPIKGETCLNADIVA